MYIKNLQINGFGNLENTKLEFKPGLNVVKGKNESGKSTLINFVKAIFYGVNKNKDGNKFSEYDRYKPWTAGEFSGKIVYNQDEKEYTIFRDFNRNNGKVYDEAGNDITSQFNKDRARGVELGIAHFHMDEKTFENSLLVKQNQVNVEEDEQKAIIQKLTNIVQLGEENTSYDKIKSRLEKMLLEEVGTDKTQNRPKNLVNKEIDLYESKKVELVQNSEKLEKLQEKITECKEKTKRLEHDYEEAKGVYDIKKKYADLLTEKQSAFETAEKLMQKEKMERSKNQKKRIETGTTLLFAILVTVLIAFLFLKQYLVTCLCGILGILGIILYRKIENKPDEIHTELNFDVTKEELSKKEQKELDLLRSNGTSNSLLERKASDLKTLCDGYEKSKNDCLIDEHKLYIELESLKEVTNQSEEVDRNLQIAYEKKAEIDFLERSIRLALNTLEEAYEELKQSLVPDLTKTIRESVEKTTGGRYKNVIYNDIQGLLVENSIGDVISIDKLSLGTIDQIYLGFRLAMASRLENIPLFLDETFVHYDEERLENILKILYDISKEKQIILLTCSDREIEILDRDKMEYYLVNNE